MEDGRIAITPHADFPRAAVAEEALRTARFCAPRPATSVSARDQVLTRLNPTSPTADTANGEQYGHGIRKRAQ